jgi:hypothetical protein
MRQLTNYILGYPLSLRSWRHIALAIDRFLLDSTSSRLVDAELSGVDHDVPYSTTTVNSPQPMDRHSPTHNDSARLCLLRVSQQWLRLARLGHGQPPLPPLPPRKADVVRTLNSYDSKICPFNTQT